MIVTLCYEQINLNIDIKVNKEQKISETVMILIDGGIIPINNKNGIYNIFSKRRGTLIDSNFSYEQSGIYNGDILYVR